MARYSNAELRSSGDRDPLRLRTATFSVATPTTARQGMILYDEESGRAPKQVEVDVRAQDGRPVVRDGPEVPRGEVAVDLGTRLERLPASHPPSPGYGDGRNRNDHADRRLPAASRPEWQDALAKGEVDRCGPGVVDERARRFLPAERRIAVTLAEDGAAVAALPEDPAIKARKPDAKVDERMTEFKSLQPGASDKTVNNQLLNARGQARHVVIDARDSGLTEQAALWGIARFNGSQYRRGGFDSIQILGDDFRISQQRRGEDERG